MNCLETRRLLLADPRADSVALSSHLSRCAVCRSFLVRLQRDEVILQQALEIPVPAQLEERILLKMQLSRRAPGKLQVFRNWLLTWLGPATWGFSGLVLASALLGLWTILPGLIQPSWGELMLSEVIGEPRALQANEEIPRQTVLAALQDYGLTLKEGMGKVQYLNHCNLPGGKGIHAVIATPDLGKVSLIIPPAGTRLKPNTSQRDGYAAQIVPLNQSSIGVVTDQANNLATLTDRLQTYLVASN